MSDGLLPLNPATLPGGQVEDVEDLIGSGGAAVIRQRLQITGALLAEIARVMSTDPVGTEYGLVTRNIQEGASTGIPSTFSASLANATYLPANSLRKMVMFQTMPISTSGNLFLKLGANALIIPTVMLIPGAYYELPMPVWKGQIDAVWDSNVGTVNVLEMT